MIKTYYLLVSLRLLYLLHKVTFDLLMTHKTVTELIMKSVSKIRMVHTFCHTLRIQKYNKGGYMLQSDRSLTVLIDNKDI